jgi:hypothetical protein
VSDEEEAQVSEGDDHISLSTLDRDAVSKVAKRVQLMDVRLRWLHAALNNKEEVPDDWRDRAFIFWDTHLSERHEDGAFTAAAGLNVRMKEGVDPSVADEPPDYDLDDLPDLELFAEYLLTYSLVDADDVSDRELEHFCYLNATANIWSYWREIMQSTTTRMGLPPLVLPVLPVPRLDS